MKIKYHNCWIKTFSNLSLSYQDEPKPLTHSFTFAYERFEIERVVPEGYHIMPDAALRQTFHDSASTYLIKTTLNAPFSASNSDLTRVHCDRPASLEIIYILFKLAVLLSIKFFKCQNTFYTISCTSSKPSVLFTLWCPPIPTFVCILLARVFFVKCIISFRCLISDRYCSF